MGVVMSLELAEQAAEGDQDRPVESAMHTDLPKVDADDDAVEAIDLLAQSRAGAVVVVNGRDDIVGVVTPADVQRAMALAALTRPLPAR